MDEGFFSTVKHREIKEEKLKRYRWFNFLRIINVELSDYLREHHSKLIPKEKVGQTLFNRPLIAVVSYKN